MANATDDASPEDRTRVFLSYSRETGALVRKIADALVQTNLFEPDFDKADYDIDRIGSGIAADEPWWQRLQDMIAGADAMIFLISPSSIVSRVCDEEIALAQRLGKRIIPVVATPIDFGALPPRLSELNIAIDFTGKNTTFEIAFSHLIRVLTKNAAWLRAGRLYSQRAIHWERNGRPEGELLRAGALEEAELWESRRPKNELEPGELFLAWVFASRTNVRTQLATEQRQVQKAKRWQVFAAAILILGFFALSFGAWVLINEQRAFNKSTSITLDRAAKQLLVDGDPRRAVLLTILSGPESALSPSTPETRALFASSAQSFRQQVAFHHAGPVSGAVFSADEKRVLTWSGYKAFLWDSQTGRQIGEAPMQRCCIGVARVSKDSRAIINWLIGGFEQLDGNTDVGPATGFDDIAAGATFSESGARVLTWRFDQTVRIWDAETGEQVGSAFRHDGPVTGAAFSKDGKRILSWSDDQTVRIWDAETGEQVGSAFRHDGPVTGAAFSKDEKRILSWSDDQTAQIWDATNRRIGPTLDLNRTVDSATFSQDGKSIITWSLDRSWRRESLVWDAETGLQFGPLEERENAFVETDFLSDRSSREERQGACDESGFPQIGSIGLPQDGFRVVFSGNCTSALTWKAFSVFASVKDADAVLWYAGSEQTVRLPLLDDGGINGAVFSNDGRRVVTLSDDRTARIWDVSTGNQVGTVLQHDNPVTGAMFSYDDTRLLTWSGDIVSSSGSARLWKVGEVSELIAIFSHQGPVEGATFSKEETRILTWGGDNTVRLWDAVTGIQIGPAMEHEPSVRGAAFSNDETRLLTWGMFTVHVWDISWAMRVDAGRIDMAEFCDQALRGNVEKTSIGPEVPFPHLIDVGMIEAAPILRGRVGEDVCKLPPRAWWDEPLLALFRWIRSKRPA